MKLPLLHPPTPGAPRRAFSRAAFSPWKHPQPQREGARLGALGAGGCKSVRLTRVASCGLPG